MQSVQILSGGAAAHVALLDIIKSDGKPKRIVVRRHRPRDLANNPDIAADEFRLLAILADAGIAAPLPIHVEPAGIFETPCLVVSHIDGTPAEENVDPDALVIAMADYLARLHRIDGNRRDLTFLPRTEQWLTDALAPAPSVPDETLSETRIRQALAALPPPATDRRPALLHGDFWPGNIIWRDGAIAGAIDWEDAAVGDPVAELANARLELAWLMGPAVRRQAHRALRRSNERRDRDGRSAALGSVGGAATGGLGRRLGGVRRGDRAQDEVAASGLRRPRDCGGGKRG